jgi:hypothetical protein
MASVHRFGGDALRAAGQRVEIRCCNGCELTRAEIAAVIDEVMAPRH